MKFAIIDGNKVNYAKYWDEMIAKGPFWNSPWFLPTACLQTGDNDAVLEEFEAEVHEELGEDKFITAKDYFYDLLKQHYPNDAF